MDKTAHHAWLRQRLGRNSTITHDYSADFLNGYSAKLDDDTLTLLRASSDVRAICEVRLVMITHGSYTYLPFKSDCVARRTAVSAAMLQLFLDTSHVECGLHAPWGLNHISQAAALTGRDPYAQDYVYTYDGKASSGIDIYVVGQQLSKS